MAAGWRHTSAVITGPNVSAVIQSAARLERGRTLNNGFGWTQLDQIWHAGGREGGREGREGRAGEGRGGEGRAGQGGEGRGGDHFVLQHLISVKKKTFKRVNNVLLEALAVYPLRGIISVCDFYGI